MKNIKKTLASLLAAAMIFLLCGCKGEEYEAAIYADIGARVSTLDPQLVSTSAERTVVLNIFEGLMKTGEDGTPTLAAAEKYEKEGNSYIFTLRKGLLWNDGTPLTAADFVFGFQRAASADTLAPEYQSIDCIKGADAVHAGGDRSLLGVTALSDRTLKIELSRDDGDFLSTLTKPITMPCNRAFFESTNGKYGRDDDSILCNGPYYLQIWDSYDYLVRIRRNSNYSGENEAIPASVYITSDTDEERTTLIKKNTLDLAFVRNTDAETLEDNGLKVDRYYTRSWFIFINKNGALGNEKIRRALSLSINRSALSGEFPDYIKPLDIAVPRVCKRGEVSVYDAVLPLVSAPQYQPDEAYRLYTDAAKSIANSAPLSIIYSGDGNIDNLVSGVASCWQRSLGCYINMTPFATNEAVLSTVGNGYYDVAVCAVDAVSDDVFDFLSSFKSGNAFGFASAEYDRAVDAVPSAGDGYISAVGSAQAFLTADNSVIPIASTPLVLAYSNSLSQVDYSIEGGYINFAKIIKK